MNLAERDRELATLRVLGASNNRLGVMLFGEHLGIRLIGGVLGCIFSVLGTVHDVFIRELVVLFHRGALNDSIFMLIGIVVFISISLTPFGCGESNEWILLRGERSLAVR